MKRSEKKDAIHVADILTKNLKKMTGRTDLTLLKLWECWSQAVGPEVAAHTRPKAFRGNLLHVTVDSSVWVHHLTLMKEEILRKINAELGDDLLTELRFTIGHLDSDDES